MIVLNLRASDCATRHEVFANDAAILAVFLAVATHAPALRGEFLDQRAGGERQR